MRFLLLRSKSTCPNAGLSVVAKRMKTGSKKKTALELAVKTVLNLSNTYSVAKLAG